MANHKSAKKRAKQSLKKRARNQGYMSMVKSIAKQFQAVVTEAKAGKKSEKDVQKAFATVQSKLQKAAAKGLLARNNVARRVSRLAHLLVK